jgi:hypothetical protein
MTIDDFKAQLTYNYRTKRSLFEWPGRKLSPRPSQWMPTGTLWQANMAMVNPLSFVFLKGQ